MSGGTAQIRSAKAGDNVPDLAVARARLTEFVLQQAADTAASIGFGWQATADAPDRFDKLQATYRRSQMTGESLLVSDEHSDSVVFTDSAVNYAMRFWHDVNHVRRRLSFQLVDELELALWHLSVAADAGFPESSLEWQLLHADLVGQIYVMSLNRRFPLDQLRFAEGCIVGGFDHGVLVESRRTAGSEHVAASALAA